MAQYRQMQPDLRTHQGHVSTSYRFGPYKPANRIRRAVKPYSHRRSSVLIISLIFLFALFVIYLYSRHGSDSDLDLKKLNQTSFQFSRELRFGHGSKSGKDSRYWDKDDRRRDQDYTEEDSPKPQNDSTTTNNNNDDNNNNNNNNNSNNNNKGKLLYNEGGRKELDSYKEEYEASIDYINNSNNNNIINPEDEYDDGIDAQDEVAMSENEEERERDKNKIKLIKERDLSQIDKKEKKSGSKKKTKKHKLSSSTCDMKFLNSTVQLTFPTPNTKFAKFSLNYTKTQQNPRFAGHQTLNEREDSYKARDQTINCGFVKGLDGKSTGFDISNDDFKYMSSCHIAVSSCIFGNSDRLRSPFGKTITRLSKKSVCFAMFLDEETLQTLLLEGQKMDNFGFIGFWKIIVIKNMPFNDMRRVGKIPKFLAHRLFPSARYSIWLDSKLRLQSDPILILEYFLWRHENEYAISNHYDRHCVWEEVAQNKKLNKFNHTIIDQQFEFYQKDGLKRFDPLDPDKLLPSYVPEGSFIVREHTPMSNLFSCLWFNEVDRFTPRDQLSFAYTYLKLRRTNPTKPFYLNMFKDCERRSIAKLFHHRSEERRSNPSESLR